MSYENIKPVSTRVLSLVGKTYQPKFKMMTTPNIGPEKTVSLIDFRIALTLDLNIVWFGRQRLFVSTNVIRMQYLGVVHLKLFFLPFVIP